MKLIRKPNSVTKKNKKNKNIAVFWPKRLETWKVGETMSLLESHYTAVHVVSSTKRHSIVCVSVCFISQTYIHLLFQT